MYLLALCLLCGLMLHGSCSAPNPLSSIQWQTVPYHSQCHTLICPSLLFFFFLHLNLMLICQVWFNSGKQHILFYSIYTLRRLFCVPFQKLQKVPKNHQLDKKLKLVLFKVECEHAPLSILFLQRDLDIFKIVNWQHWGMKNFLNAGDFPPKALVFCFVILKKIPSDLMVLKMKPVAFQHHILC